MPGSAVEASRTSINDTSAHVRGGMRSGTDREKGRTYDQLYAQAQELGIDGRSDMDKSESKAAVAGAKANR